MNLIIIAALALAIIAVSVYAAVLFNRFEEAKAEASEQAERAALAERRADELQRAADTLREVQAHADQARHEIDRTRADVLWRIDDIIDSGALDERVCELARAAYDSLVCAPDGDSMPAPGASNAP